MTEADGVIALWRVSQRVCRFLDCYAEEHRRKREMSTKMEVTHILDPLDDCKAFLCISFVHSTIVHRFQNHSEGNKTSTMEYVNEIHQFV